GRFTAQQFEEEIRRAKAKKFKRNTVTGAAIFAILLSIFSLVYYFKQPAHNAPQKRTLAIMPFRNLKPDADTDFLSYSLADAIITKLGYVQSLTVRPSSSIEKFRNQEIDVKKVSNDLKVNTLLVGTFLREGDDLHITTQLIDVNSNEMLWRDTL